VHGPEHPARGGLTPARAALLLVGLPLLLHLAVIGRLPLTTDEAHYALYGLHLDTSYFDHPPLVGWLQALALAVSDSSFALRLLPVLLAAATAWLLWRLTPRLFPEASPWVAVGALGLLASSLLLSVMGMVMVPEVPLLLLGLAVMHATLDLLEHERLSTWLRLGLLLGLAGLAKYTAFTLALSVVAALVAERGLAWLARPGPWLAAALAALLVAPVFAWNAAREWISFRYQLDHGMGGKGWSPGEFLAAQGQQLAAYGPVLYLGGWAALLSGWRERGQRGVRLSLCFGWPVLLLFGYGAGSDAGLPHWTALAFVGSAPLTARWLGRRWQRRGLRRACLGYGLVAAALLLVLHSEMFAAWIPWTSLPGARGRNPWSAVDGWDEAAREAERLAGELAATPGPPPQLYVDNWSRAARLAWAARPRPVQVLDRRVDQFDLWFGSPAAGDRGILVVWEREPEEHEPDDLRHFARHERVGSLEIVRAGQRVCSFSFHACHDYQD